jgi:hypothetical protein
MAGILLLGCRKAAQPTGPTEDQAGVVSVEWNGFVRGSFAATASGSWCARDSLLEVLAVRGDSGFGFALAVTDSVRVGKHPATAPSVVVDWRPLAVAGLRWATDTAVRGYEAQSGTIEVTDVSGGRVTGTIDLRLKQIDTIDTIRLSGSFKRIAVAPSRGSCGRVQRPGGTAPR